MSVTKEEIACAALLASAGTSSTDRNQAIGPRPEHQANTKRN